MSNFLKFRERIREVVLDKKQDMPNSVKENILNACDKIRLDLKKQNIEIKVNIKVYFIKYKI